MGHKVYPIFLVPEVPLFRTQGSYLDNFSRSRSNGGISWLIGLHPHCRMNLLGFVASLVG